jgi:hypothetical protein
MSAEHSSTPWRIATDGSVSDANNYSVADLYQPRRVDNAVFIVKAVNAHDDLVAALVDARLALRACNGSEEAIRVIDAALAKAEGWS